MNAGSGRKMGITGKLFLVSLGMVALAAGGLTLWLWPRLAGPGIRALGGRLALLTVTQLCGLLTVAAVANAYFGFYTSWDDLFGVASQSYQLTDAGSVPAEAQAAQLQADPPGAASTHGQVYTSTLAGLRSGVTADVRVFLPPQYFLAASANRYFPAVAVQASSDADAAGLASDLQHAPAARIPAVVVIVTGATGRALPCSYSSDPTGELFWGQDLRTAVAGRFRVHLDAGSWGALASGPDRDCAAALAVDDAGRYSAAAVLGPASPGAAAQTPPWWQHTYPAPPVHLLLAGLGPSAGIQAGPPRPPLQITVADTMTELGAVNWLAETLQPQNGGPA